MSCGNIRPLMGPLLIEFHLGDVIRKTRLARGWDLDQFAKRSGIDRNTISRIERNGTGQLAKLEALAKALKTTLRELHEQTTTGLLQRQLSPDQLRAAFDQWLIDSGKEKPPDAQGHRSARRRKTG